MKIFFLIFVRGTHVINNNNNKVQPIERERKLRLQPYNQLATTTATTLQLEKIFQLDDNRIMMIMMMI